MLKKENDIGEKLYLKMKGKGVEKEISGNKIK